MKYVTFKLDTRKTTENVLASLKIAINTDDALEAVSQAAMFAKVHIGSQKVKSIDVSDYGD